MSQIRGQDTKPEVIVRKVLFHHGFRFRKNVKKMLGKPDVYLKKYNTVIFINGCFWHRHKNCKRASIPKSNTNYWNKKFKRNIERDKMISKEYKKQRVNILIVWECQIKNEDFFIDLIRKIKKGEKHFDKKA